MFITCVAQEGSSKILSIRAAAEKNFLKKDSLIFYKSRLRESSLREKSKYVGALIYKYSSQISFLNRDFATASLEANKGLSYFKTHNLAEDEADTYRILGNIELLNDKSDIAYGYFRKSQMLYANCENLTNPDKVYLALNDLAYLYILNGNFSRAMELLSKTQKEAKSDEVLANTFSLFSVLSNRIDNFQESIKYFKLSKAIYLKEGRNTAALICDMNIAINHYHLKDYKKAIKELKAVLSKTTNSKEYYPLQLRGNLFLSNSYLEQSQYKQAIYYFDKVEQLVHSKQHEYDFLFESVYFETKALFLAKERKYDKAEKILLDFVENKLSGESTGSKIYFYKELIKLAKLQNKTECITAYQDSINVYEEKKRLEIQKTTTDLQIAEFKFNTIEKELELKNKENELLKLKEKNLEILITSIFGGIILSLLFFTILYSRQRKINTIREEMLLKEKQYLEIINKQKAFEIEFKNKEILDFALHISEKNEILNEIKTKLKELPQKESLLKTRVNDIMMFINNTIDQNSDKVALYAEIDDVKDSFLQKIAVLFPDLTEKEIRVASLVRMQMSSKQIGQQLNITPASVDNYRSVLRKKMQIPKEQNLQEFLSDLG